MIKTYAEAEKIWRELNSGIVFRERLEDYKEFVEYTKSERYLKFEKEFGEFSNEAIEIIKDIEQGKTTSINNHGVRVDIHSLVELEENIKDCFLVKEVDKFFRIKQGKMVSEILKEATYFYHGESMVRLKDDVVMSVVEGEKEYNFTMFTDNKFLPVSKVHGSVVFSGCNNVGEIISISVEDIIEIIQSMKITYTDSVLDIRKELKGMKSIEFKNEEHQGRFKDLMTRGRGISITDNERVPGMYIMSGNEDLYNKANELYDFVEGEFIVDVVVNDDGNLKAKFKKALSSSERKMMLLAFDMYSGNDNIGINELFSSLDSNNKKIVLKAIAMRY